MKSNKLPRKKIPRTIVEIVQKLKNNNFETYIVGGAIRDILLNRTPKDFDLSTSATPEEVKQVFKKRANIIGKRFRLVHIYNGKEDPVEISTFRKTPSKTGQTKKKVERPKKMIFDDNEYGSPKEDAFRRDFTVNALFYDPIDEELLDFTNNGIDDLHNSQVRVIGKPKTRFEEDPVRILRALKLIGQYNFSFEKETEKAVINNINLISHASSARLLLEFEKILKSQYSCQILNSFFDFGLMKYFLPNLNKIWGSRACDHMQKLLKENNSRVKNNDYRTSISISLATIALPFVEEKYGKVGYLWDVNDTSFIEVNKFVRNLFNPFKISKWVMKSVAQMILLQPHFYMPKDNNFLLSHRRYNHARELLSIQGHINLLPEIGDSWPKKTIFQEEDSQLAYYNNKPKKRSRKH